MLVEWRMTPLNIRNSWIAYFNEIFFEGFYSTSRDDPCYGYNQAHTNRKGL